MVRVWYDTEICLQDHEYVTESSRGEILDLTDEVTAKELIQKPVNESEDPEYHDSCVKQTCQSRREGIEITKHDYDLSTLVCLLLRLIVFYITDVLKMAVSLEQAYFPRLLNGPPFHPDEDMKFEAIRLKSFSHWVFLDKASPILLAKAGFVYTGNEDIVKCFVCHITKGGWSKNMKPMMVHSELNPECRFCQGIEGLNVPVYVPEATVYQEILENLHRQYCGTDTPVANSAGLSHRPVDNPDYSSATFRQSQTAETQTNFPVVATDAGTAETSRQAIGIQGALGRGHDSEAAPTREEFAPMKQESNRFASFDSNWPRQDTPDPRDLARAGFYYTGTVDRVQCVFCRGILRNWDEDDVPMDEHRRHFPMCPFVMGIEVGNIPDPTAIIAANRTGEFLNVTQPSAVVSDASLGIVTERPKHSQYAVEAARITSFRNWPSGKEQTPQMLAKAGFFYAGFGDSVKCFFCDGGLRTWERGDDPWHEHARWFPRCPYVRQVKGEDFIKAAMEGQELSTTADTARNNGGRSLPGTSAADTARKASSTAPRSVDPRELSSRMDSPVVQAVLQMDIPRERVAKVIQKRLQETGDDFPSVEALMDAIFQASNDDAASTAGPSPPPQPGPFRTKVQTVSRQIGAKGDEETEEKMVEGDEDSLGDSDSQSLMQENRELKEQRQCKICMDAEVNVVFLPCGHLVCCASCAPALPKCPICRATIRGTVRTFMS